MQVQLPIWLLGLFPLVLGACGQPLENPLPDVGPELSGQQKVVLIDSAVWVYMDEASDPFAHERPAEPDCPAWSYVEEFGVLEVDTGSCGYLSVSQPILFEAQAGDILHIAIWHDTLTASEPATGHVAIQLGEDVMWEATIEIPSTPGAYSPKLALDKAYPKGTPVVFHLHNHGSNNWRLLPIELVTGVN